MAEIYEEDAKKFKDRMNKKMDIKALRTKGKKRRDSAWDICGTDTNNYHYLEISCS